MMLYYALRCPKCGVWQNCMVERILSYTFKCRRDGCRTSRKLHHADKLGLQVQQHGPYANSTQASQMVVALNGKGPTGL